MIATRVNLFKVVSAKDEIVIGVTAAEASALGSGPVLDSLAKRLAGDGQMTVWQYAVGKDQSGNLRQTPARRVAIFRNDTMRIEPYTTPLPILPPPAP